MTNSNLFCRRMFAQCHSNFQLNYRFANLLNLARVFFTILELFVWKKVIKIRIFIKKLRAKIRVQGCNSSINQSITRLIRKLPQIVEILLDFYSNIGAKFLFSSQISWDLLKFLTLLLKSSANSIKTKVFLGE